MKRKYTFGAALALALAAPAVIAPQLVDSANAQPANAAAAEYPDVPLGHWAYPALDRLSGAGIIEGYPDGSFRGNRPMTRYEFAVAIARLLDRLPEIDLTEVNRRLAALEARPVGGGGPGGIGPIGPVGPAGAVGPVGPVGPAGTVPNIANLATKGELQDAINALTREFQTELANMGVRVDALEIRVSALENKVPAPPRTTFTPSVLHRTGYFSAISNNNVANTSGAAGGPGRDIFRGNVPVALVPGLPINVADDGEEIADKKFNYTDFELRITDRTTDRLSLHAAVRALGSTQEDPWAGEDVDVFGNFEGGQIRVREAYALADFSNRKFLGASGLTVAAGRMRHKVASGLLYDNDLSPTDMINSQFNFGPVRFNLFTGSMNNNLVGGGNHPYFGQGSIGMYGANAAPGLATSLGAATASGAGVGFGTPAAAITDDHENVARAAVNLFRIAGQPVQLGYTHMFDGARWEKGDSFDLTIPLFNRTVGFEYVRKDQYLNGGNAGNAKAYNVTVPLLRTRILDLNAAYGKADNDFEFFAASSANPYARTYAEALFDRPLALGAPMINTNAGGLGYMAAKEVYDITGTLRIPFSVLSRVPLDFRYYTANGTDAAGGGEVGLGKVWSVGSTFSVTPGMDLEVKYGEYDPRGGFEKLNYFRIGANVGF